MNVLRGKDGDYTIIKEIGRGAFADVYSVTDARGKEHAVKMIYKQQTENLNLPGSRKKAEAEIDLLSKIDHIFILKFMDSFIDSQSERWCIVTELCTGDLRQRINEKMRRNEPFEEDQILNWFTMLTSALDYLHDKRIIHRDLKPENVLFCDNDLMKLSDFGLAKILIESTGGTLCGSLAYMAPEVRNEQPYGSKCDIWSLGVLVYELCCLNRDFRKTGRKLPNNNYLNDLQTVVMSMLEQEPEERPPAKAILQTEFLRSRMKQIQRAKGVNIVKCVVVGDAIVGKSSLLESYLTNKVSQHICPALFDCHDVFKQVDGHQVNFQLWDFPGQEDYARARGLHYPNTKIFLVCFSLERKESLDNVIGRWIPELEHYCPNTPAILVGTKRDLKDDPAQESKVSSNQAKGVQKRINKKFKINCCRYYECSPWTQEGVKDVFDEAMRVVLNAPTQSKEKSTKHCIIF